MADVYVALDAERRVDVAVKVIREDLAEDPEFLRRFAREAEALARLDHPNIVRFYSLEQQGRLAFIVMDYVQGETLRGLLKQAGGPLPYATAVRVVKQVASALYYAHRRGVVHRDVKPGNIMVRADGTALLSDFGIARAADSASLVTLAVGTPAYMSPEQHRGEAASDRSDQYSLAVVAYEMLTGRRPFLGETPVAGLSVASQRVAWEHLYLPPPPPRSLCPGLPEAAEAVLLRALDKDPGRRYASVVEFAEALEQAGGQLVSAEQAAPVGLPAVAAPVAPATVVKGGEEARKPAPAAPAETPRSVFRRPAADVAVNFVLDSSLGTLLGLYAAARVRALWLERADASPAWQAVVRMAASQHVVDSASLLRAIAHAVPGLTFGLVLGIFQAWQLRAADGHRSRWVRVTVLVWMLVGALAGAALYSDEASGLTARFLEYCVVPFAVGMPLSGAVQKSLFKSWRVTPYRWWGASLFGGALIFLPVGLVLAGRWHGEAAALRALLVSAFVLLALLPGMLGSSAEDIARGQAGPLGHWLLRSAKLSLVCAVFYVGMAVLFGLLEHAVGGAWVGLAIGAYVLLLLLLGAARAIRRVARRVGA